MIIVFLLLDVLDGRKRHERLILLQKPLSSGIDDGLTNRTHVMFERHLTYVISGLHIGQIERGVFLCYYIERGFQIIRFLDVSLVCAVGVGRHAGQTQYCFVCWPLEIAIPMTCPHPMTFACVAPCKPSKRPRWKWPTMVRHSTVSPC
jgi:hypothetical protein